MENASKALIIAGAILISILLISIGIILINSGSDVAEAGTSSMASQKIQTFNSQFTQYEGTKKGSELRSLASLVNSSNATDEAHKVMLTCTAKGGGAAIHTSVSQLKPSKNYDVEIKYTTIAPTADVAKTTGSQTMAGPDKITKTETEVGYIYEILIQDAT